MAGVKNMAYEQDEAGFSYMGSEGVCESCIRDPALRDYVAGQGNFDRCDFCGGGEGVRTIGLAELFIFMAQQLGREYELEVLSPEVPSPDWDIELPTMSSFELLEFFGDPLDDGSLCISFCNAFKQDWVERDYWHGSDHERLLQSWDDFAAHVTSRSRFVFLHPDAGRGQEDPRLVAPAQMLDALRAMIEDHRLVCMLAKNDVIYRGRKHRWDEVLTSCLTLGPPHPAQSLGQRMSPRGISSFYGALDEGTCLAELRGIDGEVASVAGWQTKRDCWVVDLVNVPEPPSIFDVRGAGRRPTARFLRGFVDKISQPVHHQEDREVGYVPTQVVADYIRYCVRGPDGEAIDGILYPSSIRQGAKNIVMFVDPMPSKMTELPLALVGPVQCHRAESVRTAWALSGEYPITHAESWWRTDARHMLQQVLKYASNTVGEP